MLIHGVRMRYDLVVLDNDGVLVDSEPPANRILAACPTELGHPTGQGFGRMRPAGRMRGERPLCSPTPPGSRPCCPVDRIPPGRPFAASRLWL